MNNYLISIIIPTYNSEKYIKKAIESAVSQSYKNTEIIVVDDGSIDNTKKILKSYIDKKQIKYIFQNRKGRSSARNNGLKNSSGDFISFLDADDILIKNKIEKQLFLFNDKSDIAAVYGEINHFYDFDGNRFYKFNKKKSSGYIFKKLSKGNFINLNSVLIKKEAIKNLFFDENLEFAEDWDFWLRASKNNKFLYHPDIVALCRLKSKNNIKNLFFEQKQKLCVFKKNNIAPPISFYFKYFLSKLIFYSPFFFINNLINLIKKIIKYKQIQ